MSGVLLVTEDVELMKKVKGCLRETKANLSAICTTSRSTIDTFQTAQPDMVILETFLPESSGLEMLKTLKRINENCVFLMLSRLRTRTAIERAFRLGAHDVLQLPVDTDILRQTILHRLDSQVSQRAEDERQKE